MADTIIPNYQINGNNLPTPTSGKWTLPKSAGVNGVGHEVYEAFGEFTIQWERMLQEDFYTLTNIWNGHYNSGSATVRIPQAFATQYQFTLYSGVFINRPEISDAYDTNYVSNVKIIIRRINV